MRSRVHRIGWACLLASLVLACEQRPIDVAPETSFGSWETIELPNLPYMRSVSGSSSDNVFALGNSGTLLHYDGADWRDVQTPTAALVDLWVASTTDLFVLGTEAVYQYDGATWSTVYSHVGERMWRIWCSSPSEIYITAEKEIIRRSGTTWSVDSLPPNRRVLAIWGSGASDVYAVGYEEFIYHNDGSGWAEVRRTVRGRPLQEIWGSGPQDVYAGGFDAFLHYDGVAWKPVSLPIEIGTITAIWGSGPNDVFVFHDQGQVIHFDGFGWEPLNSTTLMRLTNAWGSGPTDVFAVGYEGKIIHYDGATWSSVAGGRPRQLRFIWGFDAHDFYVGDASSIVRYDGMRFVELPNVIGGLQTSDMWGTAADNLISVGGAGKVYHYDGMRWTRRRVPTESSLYAVSGVAPDAVWAAGYDAVLFYDGERWSAVTGSSGRGEMLYVAPRQDIFVASYSSISHFDGTAWTVSDFGPSAVLRGLWGSSSRDVYAVGSNGLMVHYDGQTWTRVPLPPPPNDFGDPWFSAIAGNSETDVFAAAYEAFYHFDGLVWSAFADKRDRSLGYLWAEPGGRLFALDGSSNISVYRP